MDAVVIFLAIAIAIIAMAFFLTWLFRKTIRQEADSEDPNANKQDGDALATWAGIGGSDQHD